jgi:hypothetical protein
MLVVLLFGSAAEASHFRFGTIAWNVPDPVGAPRTVRFVVQHAWRADSSDIVQFQFGDGTFATQTFNDPAGAPPTVTNGAGVMGGPIGSGVDVAGAPYQVYEFTVSHTYATAGTFTSFFTSCCRVSGLINGAGQSFRVESVVSLAAGNTGGPATSSTSTIALQAGAPRTYVFPASDPDLDPVTCRFATYAETGLTVPGGLMPTSPMVPALPAGGAMPTVMAVAGGC